MSTPDPSPSPSPGPGPTASPDQPSILFASPMNVLDITSGAALSMRTFLGALAARGFRAVGLQATLFDSKFGGEHLIAAGEQHKDKKILRTKVLGVEYLIVRTKDTSRGQMTAEEQERYLLLFRQEIQQRRPDMIMLWGGLLLEMTVMREAREAGIPVVFYLVSGSYSDKKTFQYVDLIITDTQATADLYRERFGFVCHPVGKFIDPGLVKAPEREPRFLTFINPSFEKGVNVFMPMARLAAQEHPEIRFLVVQSRGRWAIGLHVLKYEAKDFPNVKVIGHQRDMRKVYAVTRALLLPSLWHESGARVIAEALINDIPVIASDTGGSRELVGAGGLLLPLPEVVREKRGEPADEATARAWLRAAHRVWHDEAFFQDLTAKAREEAARHDISHNIDRFIKVVSPLVSTSKQRLGDRVRRAASGEPAPAATVLQTALARKNAALTRRNARQKAPRSGRK